MEQIKSRDLKSLKYGLVDFMFPVALAFLVGIVLGIRGCYIEGPVKNGSFGDALGALFGIPLKITILSFFAMVVIFLIYKLTFTEKNYDPKEVDSEIQKYNDLFNRISKIEKGLSLKIVD